MPHKKRKSIQLPHVWVTQFFAQPQAKLYQRPVLYLSGGELEVQNFRAVLAYSEDGLCIGFSGGQLDIVGDGLWIRALEKGRVVLCGTILKIEFSDV